jgi:hypothetical protein
MRFASVTVIALLPCASLAATHRTAGLWQITTQMHFSKGGITIPPEALEMMKQRGMKLPDFAEPHTFKRCLTPEDAANDENPGLDQSNCTTDTASWSGSHFHGEYTCSDDEASSHAVVDGDVSGNGDSFSGTVHVSGKSPHFGGDFTMDGQASGKWLGSDCAGSAD